MSKISTWFRRMRFKLQHDFFTVENVVLVLAVALCLMWTYQSITAMSRNWELAEQLTAERKKLELLSVEVETAELENDYYKTTEYQELLARKYLDKKMPGENMVIMSENSEVAKNKHVDSDDVVVEEEEKTYSNFEQWMTYLFPSY